MDGLECSEVLYSKLEDSCRVDAELYQHKYVKLNEFAETHECTFFVNECDIIKKGIFSISAACYSSAGVPFVRISNLKEMFISTEDIVLIPDSENDKHIDTELHEGDIILSKTGSPAASYVDIPQCNVSQDTVAISLKQNSKICSEYVVAYLNTKYGLAQMQKRFTGNIQTHLNLGDCKTKLIIPLFGRGFQDAIAEQFLTALNHRRLAVQSYEKATATLSSVLDINIAPKSSINSRIMSLKNSFALTGRLDAEYYQSKYDSYSGVNTDGVESYFTNEVCTQNKSTFIENNDVIFASMGVGSLGKVSLFSYDGDRPFVTDSTLRIYRAKKTACILPEVLCVFLQSTVCQELIYRYVVGSTGIINIYDDDIAKIPIPVLDAAIQKDIAEKVQESFALRRQSKQLLEHAKQAVEMAIEQGEDTALAWLKDKVK